MKYLTIYSKNKKFRCLLDNNDFNRVKKHTWWVSVKKSNYVTIYTQINRKTIILSRFLLKYKGKNVVDHINGNTLDNRKSNLRICTYKQNSYNSRIRKNNKSGRLGIDFSTKNNYRATIRINGKKIHLGQFKNIKDAIKVRKLAEIKFFGPYRSNLVTKGIAK